MEAEAETPDAVTLGKLDEVKERICSQFGAAVDKALPGDLQEVESVHSVPPGIVENVLREEELEVPQGHTEGKVGSSESIEFSESPSLAVKASEEVLQPSKDNEDKAKTILIETEAVENGSQMQKDQMDDFVEETGNTSQDDNSDACDNQTLSKISQNASEDNVGLLNFSAVTTEQNNDVNITEKLPTVPITSVSDDLNLQEEKSGAGGGTIMDDMKQKNVALFSLDHHLVENSGAVSDDQTAEICASQNEEAKGVTSSEKEESAAQKSDDYQNFKSKEEENMVSNDLVVNTKDEIIAEDLNTNNISIKEEEIMSSFQEEELECKASSNLKDMANSSETISKTEDRDDEKREGDDNLQHMLNDKKELAPGMKHGGQDFETNDLDDNLDRTPFEQVNEETKIVVASEDAEKDIKENNSSVKILNNISIGELQENESCKEDNEAKPEGEVKEELNFSEAIDEHIEKQNKEDNGTIEELSTLSNKDDNEMHERLKEASEGEAKEKILDDDSVIVNRVSIEEETIKDISQKHEAGKERAITREGQEMVELIVEDASVTDLSTTLGREELMKEIPGEDKLEVDEHEAEASEFNFPMESTFEVLDSTENEEALNTRDEEEQQKNHHADSVIETTGEESAQKKSSEDLNNTSTGLNFKATENIDIKNIKDVEDLNMIQDADCTDEITGEEIPQKEIPGEEKMEAEEHKVKAKESNFPMESTSEVIDSTEKKEQLNSRDEEEKHHADSVIETTGDESVQENSGEDLDNILTGLNFKATELTENKEIINTQDLEDLNKIQDADCTDEITGEEQIEKPAEDEMEVEEHKIEDKESSFPMESTSEVPESKEKEETLNTRDEKEQQKSHHADPVIEITGEESVQEKSREGLNNTSIGLNFEATELTKNIKIKDIKDVEDLSKIHDADCTTKEKITQQESNEKLETGPSLVRQVSEEQRNKEVLKEEEGANLNLSNTCLEKETEKASLPETEQEGNRLIDLSEGIQTTEKNFTEETIKAELTDHFADAETQKEEVIVSSDLASQEGNLSSVALNEETECLGVALNEEAELTENIKIKDRKDVEDLSKIQDADCIDEIADEEITQQESNEKLETGPSLVRQVSEEQRNEEVVKEEEGANLNLSNTCLQKETENASLPESEQEGNKLIDLSEGIQKTEKNFTEETIKEELTDHFANAETQKEEVIVSSDLASLEGNLSSAALNEEAECLGVAFNEEAELTENIELKGRKDVKDLSKIQDADCTDEIADEEITQQESNEKLDTGPSLVHQVSEEQRNEEVLKEEEGTNLNLSNTCLEKASLPETEQEGNKSIDLSEGIETIEKSFTEETTKEELTDHFANEETEKEEVIASSDLASLEGNLSSVALNEETECLGVESQKKHVDSSTTTHDEPRKGVKEITVAVPDAQVHEGNTGVPKEEHNLESIPMIKDPEITISQSQQEKTQDRETTVEVIQKCETDSMKHENSGEPDSTQVVNHSYAEECSSCAKTEKNQIFSTTFGTDGVEGELNHERNIAEDNAVNDQSTIPLKDKTIRQSGIDEDENEQNEIKLEPTLEDGNQIQSSVEPSTITIIQNEQVCYEPRISDVVEDAEIAREEDNILKDAIHIGEDTTDASTAEDKKESWKADGEVCKDLKYTEKEFIQDSIVEENSINTVGDETVTENSHKDEKVSVSLDVAEPSTEIDEHGTNGNDFVLDHSTMYDGEAAAKQSFQEDDNEKPEQEVSGEIESSVTSNDTREKIMEDDISPEPFAASTDDVDISSHEEEVHVRLEPTIQDEAVEEYTLQELSTEESHTVSFEKLTTKESSHEAEVQEELKIDASEEDGGDQTMEDGTGTNTPMVPVIERTPEVSSQEDENVAKKPIAEVVESDLEPTEGGIHYPNETEIVSLEEEEDLKESLIDRGTTEALLDELKTDSAGDDVANQTMDIHVVSEETTKGNSQEDRMEVKPPGGEAEESDLLSIEGGANFAKETEEVSLVEEEDQRKTPVNFGTRAAPSEEITKMESNDKLLYTSIGSSTSDEQVIDESQVKTENTSNIHGSNSVTLLQEELSLHEAKTDEKIVDDSNLPSKEIFSTPTEESQDAVVEDVKHIESSNLAQYATQDTFPTENPEADEAKQEKSEISVEVSALETQLAHQDIETTTASDKISNESSSNDIAEEMPQESFMLETDKPMLDTFEMKEDISNECLVEDEMMDKNIEAPLLAQTKGEIGIERADHIILKQDSEMGTENFEPKSSISEINQENLISEPKEAAVILEKEKFMELDEFRESCGSESSEPGLKQSILDDEEKFTVPCGNMERDVQEEDNIKKLDKTLGESKKEFMKVEEMLVEVQAADHSHQINDSYHTTKDVSFLQKLEAVDPSGEVTKTTKAVNHDLSHEPLSEIEMVKDRENRKGQDAIPVEDHKVDQNIQEEDSDKRDLEEAGPKSDVEDQNDVNQPMTETNANEELPHGVEIGDESENAEKQSIEEEAACVEVSTDDTLVKEVKDSDSISTERTTKTTDSNEVTETRTLARMEDQNNANAGTEASKEEILEQEDSEKLEEVSKVVSKVSEDNMEKEAKEEGDDTNNELQISPTTMVTEETSSIMKAENEAEKIVDVFQTSTEVENSKMNETIDTCIKGDDNDKTNLEKTSDMVSQLHTDEYENKDQKSVIVEKNINDTLKSDIPVRNTEESPEEDKQSVEPIIPDEYIKAAEVENLDERIDNINTTHSSAENISMGEAGEQHKEKSEFESGMDKEAFQSVSEDQIPERLVAIDKVENTDTTIIDVGSVKETFQKENQGEYIKEANCESEAEDDKLEEISKAVSKVFEDNMEKEAKEEGDDTNNVLQISPTIMVTEETSITKAENEAEKIVDVFHTSTEVESLKMDETIDTCIGGDDNDKTNPEKTSNMVSQLHTDEYENRDQKSVIVEKNINDILESDIPVRIAEESSEEDKQSVEPITPNENIKAAEVENLGEKIDNINITHSSAENISMGEACEQSEFESGMDKEAFQSVSEDQIPERLMAVDKVEDTDTTIIDVGRVKETFQKDKQGEYIKEANCESEAEVDKSKRTIEASESTENETITEELTEQPENASATENNERQVLGKEQSVNHSGQVTYDEKSTKGSHEENERKKDDVKQEVFELVDEDQISERNAEKDQGEDAFESKEAQMTEILNEHMMKGGHVTDQEVSVQENNHGEETKEAEVEEQYPTLVPEKLHYESQHVRDEEGITNVTTEEEVNQMIKSSDLVLVAQDISQAAEKTKTVDVEDKEGKSWKLDDVPVQIAPSQEAPNELTHENITRYLERKGSEAEVATDSENFVELKQTSSSDFDTVSTAKELHIKEDLPTDVFDASSVVKASHEEIQEKESEEKQEVVFVKKATMEPNIPTEDNRKNIEHQAPAPEISNEVVEKINDHNIQEKLGVNEEGLLPLLKQDETPQDFIILDKSSDVIDENKISEGDNNMAEKEEDIFIKSIVAPSVPVGLMGSSLHTAEDEERTQGEAQQNDPEVIEVDCEADQKMQNLDEETKLDSESSATKGAQLSDLLTISRKDTEQAGGKEELEIKEPLTVKEEHKTNEKEADEEGEEEHEHKKEDSGSDAPVMVEASRDIDVKQTPTKKSHSILAGVGSKVKHSISKVKKAITGKSSHHKQLSPPK